MENSNNKLITLSLMASGILTWITASILMNALAAVSTGGFSRMMSEDWVRHGVPVALGLVVFILLQTNSRVTTWADEVITELKRIVWPSRKDTMAMTIVVCVMLIISGIVLGLMDVISGSLIDWLLHRNFGLF